MARKIFLGLAMMVGACGSGHGSPAGSSASPAASASSLPAIAHPIVGMNLGAISYFGSEAPTLDRAKSADTWNAQDKGGADLTARLTYDVNGYPIGPADVAQLKVGIGVDPRDTPPIDDYVLTFAGKAQVSLLGATMQGGGSHRIALHETAGGPGYATSLGVTFADVNMADPVRDVHVVRADQLALFKAGEIYNPEFLAKTKPWGVLRFMDWNRTNGSDVQHWAERTQPDALSWATGRTGAPYEAEIALANKLHADPWLNVPAQADDDYIRQLATLVRDRLDPALKLHLELSNEVWNGSFPQSKYAQARADALWPAQKGGDGHVGSGGQLWYGYRAAQMAAIARDVFGAQAAQRLACVVATQTAWHGLEDAIFQGIARAKAGDARALFRDYAITTYWGGQLGTSDDKERAIVLGWARGGDAGLTQAFAEIEHGGTLGSNESLASQVAHYRYHSGVAAAHGLRLVAYEGGFGAYAFAYPMGDHATMVDLFKRLRDDPRMGRLYTRMVDDFAAAGGSELTVYNDVGGPSIWGTWGTSDDLFAPSARYDALKAIAAAGGR